MTTTAESPKLRIALLNELVLLDDALRNKKLNLRVLGFDQYYTFMRLQEEIEIIEIRIFLITAYLIE